jgi:hypothetical protein
VTCGLYWTDFPRFIAGGGREGHCEHDGGPALVPVIYDAITRAVVIDSVWAKGGASSRYRFLSMPNLGAADGTFV